ncbi:Oidioi.mRNA.OKI2018_I69.chr1.g421.t1.cds [Oikopleura dioica]|uniref:Oidioi.mRNA.OKI2018_I69.chr1.g421.t1.cds n=1 Tax=Oikopleura dioica TaxID=34765 RepID=A0ABN7SJS0_OIKDI|nr:Oidioi.mRNA.OKI2018_I69.chr1.g421.t1.cds [Oikopleura dioica]
MKVSIALIAAVFAEQAIPATFKDCWDKFNRELRKCERLNEPEDQLVCLFELFRDTSFCVLESLCDRFDEETDDCTSAPTAEAKCVKKILDESIFFARDQDWQTVDFQQAVRELEEDSYSCFSK